MRSAWVFAAGVVLGILLIIGGVQLARAFGGGMTGPMSPMMAQMMHNPKFMQSMASACAQAMKDPAVLRSMQEAMDNPEMRQMMQRMLEMMKRP